MQAAVDLAVDGGGLALAAGDDAIRADAAVHITNGSIAITASYEGIESGNITVSGGSVAVVPRDDGINIARRQ